MKSAVTVAVAVLLPCALYTPSNAHKPRRVCTTRTRIDHPSVTVPFSAATPAKVPLVLYYRCAYRKRRAHSLPLLILLPGTLLRPSDYSVLATILARRRFLVAIPDYTQRRFLPLRAFSPQIAAIAEHIRATRRAGFKCPANPQFVSARLITSMLRYFARPHPHRHHIRRLADITNVIIFGHSVGGGVADLFLTPACVPFSTPINLRPEDIFQNPALAAQFPLRLVCEQYTPTRLTPRVAGLVTFESLSPGTNITVPAGKFHLALHSRFADALFDSLLQGVSVEGGLVRVLIGRSNHFAPNDFVKQSGNQTPLCAVPRPPEAGFVTTRLQQRRVVKSIVKTVVVGYKVFVRGRNVRRLTALTGREDLAIGKVAVL